MVWPGVDTHNKYIYSWDVAPDGSVSGKLSLAELESGAGSYAGGSLLRSKSANCSTMPSAK